MKYALNLAGDGRILSATYEKYAPADAVLVDKLPEGDISDYLYQDGAYIYDPLPEPEEPEPTASLESRVTDLEQTSATKDEVQAVWDQMATAYNEGVQGA